MKTPYNQKQLVKLAARLNELAKATSKAAQTLTRHHVQPKNKLKTLTRQKYELDRTIKLTQKYLNQFIIENTEGPSHASGPDPENPQQDPV